MVKRKQLLNNSKGGIKMGKLEKRVYSGWAFSSDALEKRDINNEIYEEIKNKAELQYTGSGYAHKNYRVVSNPENLSNEELALIADRGNLCFGFRARGDKIVIHTD